MIRSGFAPLAELLSVTFDEVHERYKKNTSEGPNTSNLLRAKEDAGTHLTELISLRGFKAATNYDDETAEQGIADCVCRAFCLTRDKGDFIGLMFQELNIHLEIELTT